MVLFKNAIEWVMVISLSRFYHPIPWTGGVPLLVTKSQLLTGEGRKILSLKEVCN